MSAIACASCHETAEPAAHIGTVAICARCGASLVVEQNGVVRRAVALDVDALMPKDRAELAKARAAIARAGRR
jgi:uncharacterized paraquat-inducible protein A